MNVVASALTNSRVEFPFHFNPTRFARVQEWFQISWLYSCLELEIEIHSIQAFEGREMFRCLVQQKKQKTAATYMSKQNGSQIENKRDFVISY